MFIDHFDKFSIAAKTPVNNLCDFQQVSIVFTFLLYWIMVQLAVEQLE